MKLLNITTSTAPRMNNKSGALLPLVALGILAVAGLVPFLVENTESNQKTTDSIDTTNKMTWALESAIQEKYNKIDANLKGLGHSTINDEGNEAITFKYGSKSTSASLIRYNTYLNKNSCLAAVGEKNDNYDLSSLQLNMAKPGVAVINQDYYAWDKFGRLFKIEGSEKVLIPGLKVWQVVSNNGTPVVLTTKNKAYSITLDADNLLDDFDEIVCGDEVEHGKPAPDIYLKCLSKFDIDKSEALIFEDGTAGARAAIATGTRLVLVPDIAYLEDDVRNGAYKIVEDLSKVIDIIKEENERTTSV